MGFSIIKSSAPNSVLSKLSLDNEISARIWNKMSSTHDMMTSAFMQGIQYGMMMMTQMPQLNRQNTFAPGLCVPATEERQPQEDEGEHISAEEMTELRFMLHEDFDARFVEALDDEDIRLYVTQFVKDKGGPATDELVRTLETKYRITTKGEPMEAAAEVITEVSTTTTVAVPDADASWRESAWGGAWGDAVADVPELQSKVEPSEPSSMRSERATILLDAIFRSSAAQAPITTPAPEPMPLPMPEKATEEAEAEDEGEWIDVAPTPKAAPKHGHPLFGSDAFAWCRAQTGKNYLELNTLFKTWWSIKRPARHMYCGAERPMVPYNPAFGEFKYYIDNLPTGELSLHDIREMISATGIPVLDVFRPVYPDPRTGKMIAGTNIKVTVPAQYNGVSAEAALATLQAAPINFNGTVMRIQRMRGY